jgi:hypothetical protein
VATVERIYGVDVFGRFQSQKGPAWQPLHPDGSLSLPALQAVSDTIWQAFAHNMASI